MTDNRPSGDQPISHDGQHDDLPGNPPDNGMVPRFHPAHPVFGESATGSIEPSREVLLAIAGRSEGCAAEHLQQQATELAQHLQARERDMSHWEATLNARSAAHDDELRSARLWLREQQQELAGREAELAQQQISWENQRRAQEQSLEQQQRELQADCAAAATLNEQLRRRIESQRAEANERQECRTLRAELERLRAVLRERETGLIRDRHAWELEKERGQQRTLRQRQTIAQHWRFRGQTLQLQQRALRQRREQLDRRQQALEQSQAELHRAQRELLEMRLVVELARHGLSDRVRPDELAAMRLCVRELLAEHTAALESAQQRQRQELQTLSASLTHQQQTLAARHETLQQWAQEHQREFDEQTAQLDTQERELEQLHLQLMRDKQAWLGTLDEELDNAIKKASCV